LKKKLLKRYAKLAIYECMCRVYNKQLPWGALTGIRPTKVYYELLENGIENPEEKMMEIFKVSSNKAALIKNIVEQQKGLINNDNNRVNIYVGIPFCRTRCTYCTFTGGTIEQLKKYVRPYIDTLKQEIKNAFKIIEENNYILDNVYFGGGTPTTLNPDELEEIIELFDGKNIQEFTVEAGRPDTVTAEHFAMFDKHKIGRISINPQTFNDETLLRINRKHTSEDIISCYNSARKYNFIINMDLIAGLPGEDNKAFNYSLDKCLSLHPDNITVHTLALKRGSTLREQLYISNNNVSVSNMVEYASKELIKNNYNPYYLYRQKYMSENLENVGYCLNGTQCRYNIDIMERKKIYNCMWFKCY
jgi:coproporphyrinogen dehydrogenase HemZ